MTIDEAIKDEREYVEKIDCHFIALDVLMTIITITAAFGYFIAMEVVKDHNSLTK